MKATFIAPDLVVLSHLLTVSKDKDDFEKNSAELIGLADKEYSDKISAILKNPANTRFAWVMFDKSEEDIEFFTNLAVLSANNSYSSSMKDIVMTQDNVFVNVNLLEVYKTITEAADSSDKMELSLDSKISKDTLTAITTDAFDGSKFIDLYSSENGPQMFMLTGVFSSDTWNILETIGLVARRGFALQTTDGAEKIPGICLLFGLSITTLSSIAENSKRLPRHISEDFDTFPSAGKEDG